MNNYFNSITNTNYNIINNLNQINSYCIEIPSSIKELKVKDIIDVSQVNNIKQIIKYYYILYKFFNKNIIENNLDKNDSNFQNQNLFNNDNHNKILEYNNFGNFNNNIQENNQNNFGNFNNNIQENN